MSQRNRRERDSDRRRVRDDRDRRRDRDDRDRDREDRERDHRGIRSKKSRSRTPDHHARPPRHARSPERYRSRSRSIDRDRSLSLWIKQYSDDESSSCVSKVVFTAILPPGSVLMSFRDQTCTLRA
ncbi:hypothetical protein IGI04_005447 [Brassica rapa subsp. trilocularis]|uniref:Uncharacterized protein n=1 Tax=Brassica rapa subsp. trilocularis TaxID=1813537 RepID=A0ABQ7NE06_BRACM|nr:hypothetical protein IGI04_005447 [Brassica rapa subsp. trilocularis]